MDRVWLYTGRGGGGDKRRAINCCCQDGEERLKSLWNKQFPLSSACSWVLSCLLCPSPEWRSAMHDWPRAIGWKWQQEPKALRAGKASHQGALPWGGQGSTGRAWQLHLSCLFGHRVEDLPPLISGLPGIPSLKRIRIEHAGARSPTAKPASTPQSLMIFLLLSSRMRVSRPSPLSSFTAKKLLLYQVGLYLLVTLGLCLTQLAQSELVWR